MGRPARGCGIVKEMVLARRGWWGAAAVVALAAACNDPHQAAPTDAAVADAGPPALDASIDRAGEGAPDLAGDQAAARDASLPAVGCGEITAAGASIRAIVDATGIQAGLGTIGNCEGDLGFRAQANRVLCGSVPATFKAVANALGPSITQALQPGERALLLLVQYNCPLYAAGTVFNVHARRPTSDWDQLAAMLKSAPDAGADR
jgi:hypothetical protein